MTRTLIAIIVCVTIVVCGMYAFLPYSVKRHSPSQNQSPAIVTISGTFVCLPHLPPDPLTEECAFGFQSDDGVYYAVNFGQSAYAMELFQSGAYVTATGFVTKREELNDQQWEKYRMKGLLTIVSLLATSTVP